MSEAKTPKKIGRPPKNPGEGKRPTITFRCRAPLHERIQAAARDADRSVSDEVETRLDRSYDADDKSLENLNATIDAAQNVIFNILYDGVGGKHNFSAGQRFASALKRHQAEADAKFRSEKPWYDDVDKRKYVQDKVSDLVGAIIDMLAEEIDPEAAERRRREQADFYRNSTLGKLGQMGFAPGDGETEK